MQNVASSVNDPMLRFNTSVLTGNVEERVRTLISAGQLPLAYMAARAHNLTDMVEEIESEMTDNADFDETAIMDETQKYIAKSKALVPLRPINMQEGASYFSQWPMTNLRAREAEKAAAMFQSRKFLNTENADEQFFDSNQFGSSNKEVANILEAKGGAEAQRQKPATEVNIEEAAWGDDEDDLDIEDDTAGQTAVGGTPNDADEAVGDDQDSGIFVPPSPGPDPYQAILKKNPTNVALNAACGDFEKGLELLKSQLSVANFGPLKQLFVDAYTLNKVKLKTLPHGPALDLKVKTSGLMPLLPVTVASMEQRMANGIGLTTKGDFEGALRCFQSCVQGVALMAVQTS